MDFPKDFVIKNFSDRGTVFHTETGSVIQTDHGKFLLIVKSLEESLKCVVINHALSKHAQVCDQPKVTEDDISCLNAYDVSYVNCSEIISIEMETYKKRIEDKTFVPKGHMSERAMAEILNAGQHCTKLKPFEQNFFR